jgi:hypothetical protein
MANPSQSQDVEHKGPRSNPLSSRQRQPGGSFAERVVQGELDREADPGPEHRDNLGDDDSDEPRP